MGSFQLPPALVTMSWLLLRVSSACGPSESQSTIPGSIGHCSSELLDFHSAEGRGILSNTSQILGTNVGGPEYPEQLAQVPDPSSSLWEVRPIPGKGLGVVATQNIQCGTKILTEEPYIYVPVPIMYEGQGYRVADMLADIEKGFSFLSLEQQTEVLQLHDHRFLNEENQSHLLTIFRSNAYNSGDDHIGLFPKCARINHSCRPNCLNFWSEKTSKRIIYAGRDIEKGEEITVSYIPLLKSTQQRQERLQQYGFTCTCSACQSSESSKRRVKIAEALESLEQKLHSASAKIALIEKRISKTLALIEMIEEEDLTDYLARAFHLAAVFNKQNRNFKIAREWALKELEIHQWAEIDSAEALATLEFIDGL